MSDVNVTVIGHAGNTPTMHVSNSGTKWTYLRVASTRRRYTPEGWVDGATLWFTVRTYGSKAQNVVDSIEKGTPVIVVGRLAMESYDLQKPSDGLVSELVTERRFSQVIENPTVAVDISRGVAKWERMINNDVIPPSAFARAVDERSDEAREFDAFGDPSDATSPFELEPVAL